MELFTKCSGNISRKHVLVWGAPKADPRQKFKWQVVFLISKNNADRGVIQDERKEKIDNEASYPWGWLDFKTLRWGVSIPAMAPSYFSFKGQGVGIFIPRLWLKLPLLKQAPCLLHRQTTCPLAEKCRHGQLESRPECPEWLGLRDVRDVD